MIDAHLAKGVQTHDWAHGGFEFDQARKPVMRRGPCLHPQMNTMLETRPCYRAHPTMSSLGAAVPPRHAAQGDSPPVVSYHGTGARGADQCRGRDCAQAARDAGIRALGASEPIFFSFPDNRPIRSDLLDIIRRLTCYRKLAPVTIYTHQIGHLNVSRPLSSAVLTACRLCPGSTSRIYVIEILRGHGRNTPDDRDCIPAQSILSTFRNYCDAKRRALSAYAERIAISASRAPRGIEATRVLRGASAGP